MTRKQIESMKDKLTMFAEDHEDMIGNCADTNKGQDRSSWLEERKSRVEEVIDALDLLLDEWEYAA